MAEINSLSDVRNKPMRSPLGALFSTVEGATGQVSPIKPLVEAVTTNDIAPVPTPVPDQGEFSQGAPVPEAPVPEAPIPEAPVPMQQPVMATTTQSNTAIGSSSTVQPGVQFSPEVLAMQAASIKKGQEAIKAGQEVGVAKAAEETAHMVERDRLMQAHQEKTAQEEIRRQKVLADDQKNVKDAIGEVASSTIDPNRLMQKDTANAILAAIGSALGAYASTISGAPNFAQQIIDKAIDRDIDSQKTALANKQQKVENLRGTYKDNLARFGDERQAELVTRAQIIEGAKMKLETVGAKFGGAESNAKAVALQAGLLEKSASIQREIEERSQDKVSKTTSSQTNIQSVTAPMTSGLSAKDKFNNTTEAKNELRKVLATAQDRTEKIKAVENLMKDADNPVSKAQIGTAIIKLQETGVISDADKKDFQTVGGILGNISAYTSGKVSGKFTAAELKNLQSFLNKAKSAADDEIGLRTSEHMEQYKKSFGTMVGDVSEIYTPSQIKAAYSYANKSKQKEAANKANSGMSERK